MLSAVRVVPSASVPAGRTWETFTYDVTDHLPVNAITLLRTPSKA
jgi:hypothetical protein